MNALFKYKVYHNSIKFGYAAKISIPDIPPVWLFKVILLFLLFCKHNNFYVLFIASLFNKIVFRLFVFILKAL